MKYKIMLLCALLAPFFQEVSAQGPPPYTRKLLVRQHDTTEFIASSHENGFVRTYLEIPTSIYDVDDQNTTAIRGDVFVLICIEGNNVNGKKHGLFTSYVIDSLDHKKRYKIWEQSYVHNKLDGEWRFYNLAGTRVNVKNFRQDSLHGKSTTYWIDGKRIMEETEFFNGRDNGIYRKFDNNGRMISEMPFKNGKREGTAKMFYPDGSIKEDAVFKNDMLNGLNRYYYPSGQVWIEKEYKDDKLWTVLANYTEDGKKRDPGTLKNGNGTIIYYNEDGTVREKMNHLNGEPQR